MYTSKSPGSLTVPVALRQPGVLLAYLNFFLARYFFQYFYMVHAAWS